MHNSNAESWGSATVSVQISSFQITFTGLSELQRSAIRTLYSNFLCSADTSENRRSECQDETTKGKIVCSIEASSEKIESPIEHLQFNGQYSPRITEAAGGIEIQGMNFKAYQGLNSDSQDSTAWIQVHGELDIANPVVIENYLRIAIAFRAAYYQGAVVHSAGVVFQDQAYLFVGHSGVGKSTFSEKAYNRGALILSDDMNLIMPNTCGGYNACKVPFMGEFGQEIDEQHLGASYSLAAILFLEQSEDLEVKPLSVSESVARMVASSPFVNTKQNMIERMIDLYANVFAGVPSFNLKSRRETSSDAVFSEIQTFVTNHD